MKKISAVSAVLLTACTGQADTQSAAGNAQQPPKPVFTVKFIDESAIRGLPLADAAEDADDSGKRRLIYRIRGMSGENGLQLTGSRPGDLESVGGKCMETDAEGKKAGWTQEGVCHALFAGLVANVAENADTLTTYLTTHAGLLPYREGRTGYAAVQNGRYILELDSDGLFAFRRRNI